MSIGNMIKVPKVIIRSTNGLLQLRFVLYGIFLEHNQVIHLQIVDSCLCATVAEWNSYSGNVRIAKPKILLIWTFREKVCWFIVFIVRLKNVFMGYPEILAFFCFSVPSWGELVLWISVLWGVVVLTDLGVVPSHLTSPNSPTEWAISKEDFSFLYKEVLCWKY